ncbi:MAG TPA: hypothetical protein DCP03_10305 [Polaromonas sp.]|nr:hypothetical protein [Polaromonas sp.]
MGVALATIGAFLVWYFIAQVNFADKEAYLRGEGVLEILDPKPEDIRKLKLEMALSRVGLGLILVGGLLQITSNYLA